MAFGTQKLEEGADDAHLFTLIRIKSIFEYIHCLKLLLCLLSLNLLALGTFPTFGTSLNSHIHPARLALLQLTALAPVSNHINLLATIALNVHFFLLLVKRNLNLAVAAVNDHKSI